MILFIRINDYSDILILEGKTQFIAFSYLIVFIFNLIFGLISIHFLGLIGPVYVTFTSIVLIAIFQLIKTARILNTNLLYYINFFKLILILILDVLLIYSIYFILSIFIESKYIIIISCSLLFLVAHYFIIYKFDIMDSSIKNKINQVFKRVWA